MRLLYLTADPGVPVFGGKGASIHVRQMVRAFMDLGHEVIVVSPRLEAGDEHLPADVRCEQIPSVRPRSASSASEVADQIDAQSAAVEQIARREAVDGIYERYSLSSCAGARAAAALSVPLIVEVNAPLRAEELRFRQLAHEAVALAAERETFEAASLLVAVSQWLGDWLVSVGVSAERVAVIPNPPPEGQFEVRGELAETDLVAVGFAGSLKPWHGVETLIEGFQLAASRGARMRLEVVGDGPGAPIVERASAGSDQVSWLGRLPHDQVLERLRRWDIGVAPYVGLDDFYFSPLKLTEYMAAGLCPVVSCVGGLPDLVEHGRCGVLIPPEDPDALADALLGLDSDRARLRELGRRAQHRVAQAPSWRAVAARVSAAFHPGPAAHAVRSDSAL